jgi:phosphatidate phosphatase LPIN
MQYVRSISGSVSKTWNSINPATLSGAIDVIVVEHEDGEPIANSVIGQSMKLMADRLASMFAVSRSLWKVLSPSSIRKEGADAPNLTLT